jgi:hypothetical protein
LGHNSSGIIVSGGKAITKEILLFGKQNSGNLLILTFPITAINGNSVTMSCKVSNGAGAVDIRKRH